MMLTGLDFYLVQKHLKRLRGCFSKEDRKAVLERCEREDGKEIREAVERQFLDEWQRRKDDT